MRCWLVALALAGCFHDEEDDVFVGEPPDLAVHTPAPAPRTDGGWPLGSERAQPPATLALHVAAGAPVTVPDGQYGFVVTANGRGGYRVAWVDAAGAQLRFHGSLFTDGEFSQIVPTNMRYARLDPSGGRLDFESQPGAGQLGTVDVVSSTDPIVVDVLAGASDGLIYYADPSGAQRTIATPAAFTSP
jgi:hypothetical protein